MKIQHISTILCLLLLPIASFSQQPLERAVLISSTLEQDSITLNWNADDSAEFYHIFSRALEATEWEGPIATLPGTTQSFTQYLAPGTAKTYGIWKSDPEPYRDTLFAIAGSYDYILEDQFEKGLCCNFGIGYFLLTDGTNDLIQAADFGAEQSGSFTLTNDATLYLEIQPDLFGNHLGWQINNVGDNTVLSEFGPLGTYLRRAPSMGMISVANKYDPQITNDGILVLVEESLYVPLESELEQMRQDLMSEGYRPRFFPININSPVDSVKGIIQEQYELLSNLTTIYLLGHVPVPYSGDMYPDTHTDIHWGAWAADPYYADLDGVFTDETVTQTAAFFERNKNLPGDGKFDQSMMPSPLEFIIGRVDFHDLTDLSTDELTLTRNYLNKVHEWKVGNVNVQQKGIIDDNFGRAFGASASNGWRNMASLLGPDNVSEKDFLTTLSQESHLWAFGCGSGQSFMCEGVARTEDFETVDVQAVFLMTFGSNFGDFDSENNFLRSPLTSGLVLSNAWVGNPHWYMHQMGIGRRIGEVALKNMNSHYLPAPQLMHMALMGDPTVDQYPVKSLELLFPGNIGTIVEVAWGTGPNTFDRFQIYHRTNSEFEWTYLGSTPGDVLNFTHNDAVEGFNEYLVIPEILINNNSGCFYKKGLGSIRDLDLTGVATKDPTSENQLSFYPNPAYDSVVIEDLSNGDQLRILNSNGQLIFEKKVAENGSMTIPMSGWVNGVYLIEVNGRSGKLVKTE